VYAELNAHGIVAIDSLGLRSVPTNAIFGARDNKVVLKSAVVGVDSLTPAQISRLEDLISQDGVLANSLKDLPVMRFLTDAALQGRTRLYAVITSSLPARVACLEVLPAASVVFSAWDELEPVIGHSLPLTRQSVREAIERISRRAPQAMTFVTMGKCGVVVRDPDGSVSNVCLASGISRVVQGIVGRAPACVCGCGDAFAAGVYAFLEAGRSLVPGGRDYTMAVQVAVAGCGSAIRWLGYKHELVQGDFSVSAW
jgi:sugar/nucleoside kinase (ribokinase family)